MDGYTYDGFGGIRTQTASSDNPFLFTGEPRDSQPGVAGGGYQDHRFGRNEYANGRYRTQDNVRDKRL